VALPLGLLLHPDAVLGESISDFGKKQLSALSGSSDARQQPGALPWNNAENQLRELLYYITGKKKKDRCVFLDGEAVLICAQVCAAVERSTL